MAARKGNGFPVWTQPARVRVAPDAYLRCPNCNSTNLKKVSLAYQQGLFHSVAHTRLRAVSVGSCGPDLLIGTATTRGVHQSVLSKQLSPPVKWPYRKPVLWWAVVSFSIGWIVFYVNSFMKHSSAVLSPQLIHFVRISVAIFLLLVVRFWRHNQFTYKPRYAQWERWFLCQCCGTLAEQEQAFHKSGTGTTLAMESATCLSLASDEGRGRVGAHARVKKFEQQPDV